MTNFIGKVPTLLIAIVASVVADVAAADPLLIAVIGDSNVQGKGVAASDSYPAKLERALVARGYDVRVLNSGANGDTTQGVLSRLDSAAPPATKVAIVWVGINDLRKGVPLATVKADREAIASRLRARGIQPIILDRRAGGGLHGRPEYNVGDQQQHLNPAGYEVVVARTLPQVEAAVRRAGGKHR
jgi:acyl-CoA thioesterase I